MPLGFGASWATLTRDIAPGMSEVVCNGDVKNVNGLKHGFESQNCLGTADVNVGSSVAAVLLVLAIVEQYCHPS